MAAVRAVGFDLGDTLLFYRDTPLSWTSRYADALAAVAKACGIIPTAEQIVIGHKILLEYNTRARPRTHEVRAEDIFARLLDSWKADPANGVADAVRAFFYFFQQSMSPFPDAIPALRELREEGMRIGLLTDVPYGMPLPFVQRDIAAAGLTDFVDALVTSSLAGVRKPDPGGYFNLCVQLAVAPEEMLYVGNEPKDVIGADRAGIRAVFLDRAKAGGVHGQTFTIFSLAELGKIIREAA